MESVSRREAISLCLVIITLKMPVLRSLPPCISVCLVNKLRRDYVVFSYFPHAAQAQGQGQPSYFEIIALEDFTEVTWTPTYDTAGTGLFVVYNDTEFLGDIDPVGFRSGPRQRQLVIKYTKLFELTR